ncbi:MAG: hypothetical protein ACTIDE_01565 [Carnobacterium maltaromaticum]
MKKIWLKGLLMFGAVTLCLVVGSKNALADESDLIIEDTPHYAGEYNEEIGAYYGYESGQIVPTAGNEGTPNARGVRLVFPDLRYRAHIQNYGWQGYVSDAAISGTTGRGLRMEAVQAYLQHGTNVYGGGIQYQVWSGNGWLPYVKDLSDYAGTTGRSLAMQGFRGQLYGGVNNKFYIKYSVHVKNRGWLPFVNQGQDAGLPGSGLQVEAIKIYLMVR